MVKEMAGRVRPFIAWKCHCKAPGQTDSQVNIMHLSICNLNILLPLPGILRAFDTLPFPGSREFDFRTAGRGGEFDTKQQKVGNLTVRTRRAKRKC